MANEEHLDILSQGVEAWNEWREETDEIPELQHVLLIRPNLHGINLQGADLRWANLDQANLRRADLRGAKLHTTSLFGSKLQEAKLHGAYLHRTDLALANLRGADLDGAYLHEANLHRANLRKTVFSYARLDSVNLQDVTLGFTFFVQTLFNNVKGLDSVHHRFPSHLDYFTIAKADPPLSLPFLQGCGLPDPVINNVEALRRDSMQLFSCFISYSSANEDFAQRLHADLQHEGVRC